ncbi:tRNA (guanine(26)-N(2))-dimethyltransferase isoform X2 [Cylas formicarius]|uniref:tRNA (guanine(26)-N(2))-dimethyltransferase isoform X2 n=1 Tax=Cylas formicarius TaxID=197179 RepID=UPI0029588558|nr:tRNA (guanine(26)-N(2))-dimethyltransferase isoform X2 [Cylas formicarius]
MFKTRLCYANRVKFLRGFGSMENCVEQEIVEGSAKILTTGNVFYNPVQEFNRDLSIAVIRTYEQILHIEKNEAKGKEYKGLSILEALSATGLRSIRYAQEIPGVKEIIANDLSRKAVEDIRTNIIRNHVQHIITPSHSEATMLMYEHRKDNLFDIIDLDPYGCPSIFLDSAVQSIENGGLLLVTATDMAVLAGNSPETCYSKYGSVSLRIKSCHEMAVRILLRCIESHANRYSRYIVPLLSLSADFYIRVFVRVYSGAQKCKHTLSKLAYVYHCTGCDNFTLQPLGITKVNEKNNQEKFCLPAASKVPENCDNCGGTIHIGGPIWAAPIHKHDFVGQVLNIAMQSLNTFKRIQGVLSVICEELSDVPLYYAVEKLAGTIHVETPPMMSLRSAILNAGYEVSYTHMNKTSFKTNAPSRVVWDIMRCWEKIHPASKKRIAHNQIAVTILGQRPEKEYSFQDHPEANPESKKRGFLRFQMNPLPFWGPGSRATALLGQGKIEKSVKNQGKRKREVSEESATK